MIPRAIHHRRKRRAPAPLPPDLETEHRCPQSHPYGGSATLLDQSLERRDSEASSAADFFFASLDEEPTTNERRTVNQPLSQFLSAREARQCLAELNAVFGLTGSNEICSSHKKQFTSSAPKSVSDLENGCLSRRSTSDLEFRPLKSSMRSSSSLKSFSSQTMRPTVSFSKLDIREYGIALSDHPSCSSGPPIQLGWDYSETKELKLEEYEKIRSSSRSEKREDMLLSYDTRDYLLREYAGCSRDEIQRSIQEVERVKRDRLITDLWMPANLFTERMNDAVNHMAHIWSAHR